MKWKDIFFIHSYRFIKKSHLQSMVELQRFKNIQKCEIIHKNMQNNTMLNCIKNEILHKSDTKTSLPIIQITRITYKNIVSFNNCT